MRPRLGDDLIAIAAIATGAAISLGLTALVFPTRPTLRPIVRVEVRAEKRPIAEGIGLQIPGGYRAIAVQVEDTVALAGWVRAESHVDVLVEHADGAGAPFAALVTEDVKVLGNQRSVTRSREGETRAVAVVTLLVTPDQAAHVAEAAASGSLHLTLRNTTPERASRPKPLNPPAVVELAPRPPRP